MAFVGAGWVVFGAVLTGAAALTGAVVLAGAPFVYVAVLAG